MTTSEATNDYRRIHNTLSVAADQAATASTELRDWLRDIRDDDPDFNAVYDILALVKEANQKLQEARRRMEGTVRAEMAEVPA